MGHISRNSITSDPTKIYHVMSRAVEGRAIFLGEEELLRFVFQIYAANYGRPGVNIFRKDVAKAAQMILRGEAPPSDSVIIEHDGLVHILSFALVANHYHFALVPRVQHGVSRFMQKLKNGFAKFFNAKYERRGTLFEGPYKIVSIESIPQIDAILRYINVKNVLDVYQPGWREYGLKNKDGGRQFLSRYPYSSFPDLFGERNSMLIAPEEIRNRYFGEGVLQRENFLPFVEETLFTDEYSSRGIFLEE